MFGASLYEVTSFPMKPSEIFHKRAAQRQREGYDYDNALLKQILDYLDWLESKGIIPPPKPDNEDLTAL